MCESFFATLFDILPTPNATLRRYAKSFICVSRNCRFSSLPVGFFGSASAKTTRLGTLKEANWRRRTRLLRFLLRSGRA